VAETNYQHEIRPPYVRKRFHLVTERGVPIEFTIQLEYDRSRIAAGPDRWGPLARFDHNQNAIDGHDVRQEGLHLDLLDPDGSKHDVRRSFQYRHIKQYPPYCEDYLEKYCDTLVRDYERRNDIRDGLFSP